MSRVDAGKSKNSRKSVKNEERRGTVHAGVKSIEKMAEYGGKKG